MGDIELGGRELFTKIEKVFFEEFLASYADHVEKVWRSNEMLIYLIGGNPRLAQLMAQWLWHHSENDGAHFEWPSEDIQLKGHDALGRTMRVNSRNCMDYLTKSADPMEMLNDPLVKMMQPDLWKLAHSASTVDIFDESTWRGDDYKDLREIVQTIIIIHPTQNQRVENHVQLAALVRKTNVGEARATARGMIHSYLIRRNNEKSLAAKKARINDEKKRAKAQRTKDKERIQSFANEMDQFNDGVRELQERPGYEAKLKIIIDDMR